MEEQNLDLLCYDFNQELISLINKYGNKLPASIVFILIKEVLNQIEEEKNKIVIKLLSEREKEAKKTIDVPVQIIKEE